MAYLPPSELKIARVLLAAYPSAGLGSAADLAQRAGVSAPTVVRFVARIGYPGYREMQRLLREELQREQTASPLTIAPRTQDGTLRSAAAEVFTETVARTFGDVPDAELDAAVAALADTSKRVIAFGGRYSHVLATYLDLHLRQMRRRTRALTDAPSRRAGFLLDLGKRDVCVAFDFRRYQRDVIDLGRYAQSRGATLVLVTDPWLSPLATDADIVLPARVEGPSPFDSIVPATALVETLVGGVLDTLGDRARLRMQEAESLTTAGALETFST